MTVLFQLFFVTALACFTVSGYNIQQDYDLDTDWSNQFVSSDSALSDNELSKYSESTELEMLEGNTIEDDSDLDRPDQMIFPESDMNDEYLEGRSKSIKLETSENDAHQQEHRKVEKYCRLGNRAWRKPKTRIRYGKCFICICHTKGKWECAFSLSLCPSFPCRKVYYSAATQVCCFGKVYEKKAGYNCCGVSYYNKKISKCCRYYLVRQHKAKCIPHRHG